MLQGHALGTSHFTQGTELVEHVVHQFLGRCVDMPATETHQVTKAWVRADGHTQLLGALDGAAHGARIASVKAGGDIGRADIAHQLCVDAVADGPGAKAFAHV